MKIETKYNIGDHIWIVYEGNGEVHVYDDYITSIFYEDSGIGYMSKILIEDIKEDDIILYEDKDKLVNTIKDLMQQIKEKEEHENT